MDSVCKALGTNIRRISVPYQNLMLHPEVNAKDATLDIQDGFMVIDYNAGEKLFKLKIKGDKGTYQEFEYDADSVSILLEDIENEMFSYFGVAKTAPSMTEHDVKSIMRPGW